MRLNIGCGPVLAEGWVNADVAADADEIVDVRFLSSHWADMPGCFDYVYAGHVLHMLTVDDLLLSLREIRYVLKPGGVFRWVDFDAVKAINLWCDGLTLDLPVSADLEPTPDGRLLRYLSWHGTRRTLLSPMYAASLLHRAGYDWTFGAPGECELDLTPDRSAESFYIEGR
jgi:SAM-dependent methyltransferase